VEGKFFELAYCSTITATRGLVEEDRVVERLRVVLADCAHEIPANRLKSSTLPS
jgi:hypothetical protein